MSAGDYENRAENHRRAAGEQAMGLMDLTGPDYLSRVDNVSDAILELATFLRRRGKEWEWVGASLGGLVGAQVAAMIQDDELGGTP